jgi:hypothetical protein
MSARCCVWAIAAVLLVSTATSCSSGGGKSAGTTVDRRTTTTVGFPDSVGRGHSVPPPLVPALGPCPKRDPTSSAGASLSRMNAGVQRLDQHLVPIEALAVRVCEYIINGAPTGLVASGALTLSAARLLANETNRLPRYRGQPNCYGPSPTASAYSVFVATFASGSQQVDVEAASECGGEVWNGPLFAHPSAKWFNDLQRSTPCPALTTGPGAPPSPPLPFCEAIAGASG